MHSYTSLPSRTPESATEALVAACHDDTYILGGEEAVIAGAARIMSSHACQHKNIMVFCVDTDKVNHASAKLGATVAPDCPAALGMALGHDHFSTGHVQHRCDPYCEKVEPLAG